MNIDEILDLLERYQRGNCTEEERKAVEDWYNSLQLGSDAPLSEVEVDQSLARIRQRLPGIGDESGQMAGRRLRDEGEQTPGRRLRDESGHVAGRVARMGARRWRYMAAAVAVVLLGFSVGWLVRGGRDRLTDLARLEDPQGDTLVVTGKGETYQLTLPDGSSVQLNAGSVFRYPKKFPASGRTVSLVRGEAYFQVRPDPRRPFSVIAGNLQTRVLGTSFDIRAYEEEQTIQVALLTGKVQVAAGDRSEPVELSPHQVLRVDRPTGKADTAFFENEYEVAAWKLGAINFKDAAFQTLAFEIGNKFNVRLINCSSKRKWSYTGLFRDEGLQEVIETICQTEHLSYTFRDNEILIDDK